jgi:hypothetical protein
MGSNEEQIQLLVSEHVDHVSYALVLYSVAFLMYFCTYPFLVGSNISNLILDQTIFNNRKER